MMNDDNQQNWNTLLQKLTSRTPDPTSKSTDESSQLGLLFQGIPSTKSNGNSPDIKHPASDTNPVGKEDLSSSRRSETLQNSLIMNYVDEIQELQIKDVRNFDTEERTGRTMALNSKFICYSDIENALVIKSLKNLSLIHTIQDSKEKIIDIVFLEDALLNYLAFIYNDGTIVVINIEESPNKDQIAPKYLLKFNLGQRCDKAQIQWKEPTQLGVVIDKKLILLQVQVEDADSESLENAPQPSSNNIIEFDLNIQDFSFSPSFPLVYVLFENNNVRIHNLENNSTVKEFTPHPSETVVRLLTYKSLIRHEPIKSNAEGDKSYDHTWRDIFLTATQGFEIKVWDLSEWDENNKTYLCLETFQLNQNNDKLDPIPLIKRFIFYDAGLNFIFIGFKTNGDKGVCLNALHIDQFYCGYSDVYDQVKRTKKFFNSIQTIWFKKNDVSDFSVLNFGDDESEFYFKENSYPQMNDGEPASTRTQDGSYACNSKSILSFFVHNDSSISVFKVLGDKLYPFALVEEFDKLTQAEQLENQPINVDSSHPPDISVLNPFIKDLLDQNKKTQLKEAENKNIIITKGGKKTESADLQKLSTAKTKEQTDTISPEPAKHHAHSRKSKGGRDKDKEKDKDPDSHEYHGKHKGQQIKVVTRDNQKNVQQGTKSVEAYEKDPQIQSIEKGIEKKFQEFMDKIPQLLTSKLNKIEEVIENKVNERVAKLEMDLIGGALSKEIDEKMQREFSHAFEKTVTPSLEKYLAKVFEQVCASFEKGHKYYIDKLNLEQAKSAQVKETMNEVVKSFVQISNSLTEGYVNNQNNFSKMETNIQDKQNQLLRLIEQMNEILQKQQEIQKQVDTIEKNMQELSVQHQSEVEMFRETANRYLDRFSEISGPYGSNLDNATKIQERIKKEAPYQQNFYGMYPQGGANQFYNPAKTSKEKVAHPLNDQLAYLQAIMSGRPMDLSGGALPRGPPISLPGMISPGSSQVFGSNPYGGQFDYYNPYQKAKSQLPNYGNINQNQNQPIIPNPHNIPSNIHQPFYNPNQGNQPVPGGGSFPPEVQAFYQNLNELLKMQNKDKEEDKEKERTFTNTQENSPYLPNFVGQDKKFFDLAQVAQGGAGNTSQASLNSQRTLSQVENPQLNNPQTQTNQQDKGSGSSKNSDSLPPGMQTPTQNPNQPNFLQTLYQNLPQNIQQQMNQAQNLNNPKIGPNFNQNVPQQNSSPNQNVQNPMFNPNLYFQNNQSQQGFGNFNPNAGHYGLPPQMTNPQIKVSKNTSSVDISQIPLVNSMFKTPSRDAVEETSSTDGTTNN